MLLVSQACQFSESDKITYTRKGDQGENVAVTAYHRMVWAVTKKIR